MPDYDLILKGGTVLDPCNCFDDHADLGIRDGVVEAVESELDPARGRRSRGRLRSLGDARPDRHPRPRGGTVRKLGPRARIRDARPRRHNHRNGHGRHGRVANRRHQAARRRTQRGRELRAHPGCDYPRRAAIENCRPRHRELARSGRAVSVLRSSAGMTRSARRRRATLSPSRTISRAYVAFHLGTTETGSQLKGLREVPDLVGRGRLHVCHVNSYCRGVIADTASECREALEIIEGMSGQLNTEVYHAVQNGTTGRCDNEGNVIADVPRNCLRLRGYEPTYEGMRQAISDGYASVLAQKDGADLLRPTSGGAEAVRGRAQQRRDELSR